jgi:hypothetical protein
LVSRSRDVVAIEQHDLARSERGTDERRDVLGAILEKQLQLLVERQPAFRHALAQLHSPRSARRFAARHALQAALRAMRREPAQDGAFARAVNSLDDYEPAGSIRSGHGGAV